MESAEAPHANSQSLPAPEPNLVPLPFCPSGSLQTPPASSQPSVNQGRFLNASLSPSPFEGSEPPLGYASEADRRGPAISGAPPSPNPWDALSTEPSPRTLATSAAGPCDEDLSNDWASQEEEGSGSQQADASWEIVSGAGLIVEDGPSQGGACAFSDAFVRMTDGGASGLVLPWETPLMRAIFSDDIPTSMGLCEPNLAIPGDAPQVPVAGLAISGGRQSTPRAASGSSWAEQAIMPMLDEVPSDRSSRLLAQCVTKWRLILNRYHSEQSTQTPEDDEIEACFGTRSVHTIAKRANSCLSFLRWFDVMGPLHLRPFCDEASWSYIGFVRRSGAGASCAEVLPIRDGYGQS